MYRPLLTFVLPPYFHPLRLITLLALAGCGGYRSHEVPGEVVTEDGAVAMPADSGSMSAHEPPDAGPEAVDAGRADAAVPSKVSVHGKAVGPLLEPLEGWQVALGDRVVTTDESGSFAFEDVTTPYDLYLRGQTYQGDRELWHFQGLTREDPTLQTRDQTRGPVVQGRDLDITTLNVPEARPGWGYEVVLAMTFGSAIQATDWAATDSGGNSGLWWVGTPDLPGIMHGLAIARPVGRLDGLRNRYLSYTEVPFTLHSVRASSQSDPEWRQPLTLDFSPNEVRTQRYRVRAESAWRDPPLVDRQAYATLVFDSHAPLTLASLDVNEVWQTRPTSVSMPTIPESRVVFVARQFVEESNPFGGTEAFGCAHGEATSRDEPVVLHIPEPPTLIAPKDQAKPVDHDTVFEWSAGSSASHLSAICQVKVDGTYSSVALHVVTMEHTTTLPKSAALGVELPGDGWCGWSVAVHNAYPTVDAALHPGGMLAPCATWSDSMLRGEGSGSVSDGRNFFLYP